MRKSLGTEGSRKFLIRRIRIETCPRQPPVIRSVPRNPNHRNYCDDSRSYYDRSKLLRQVEIFTQSMGAIGMSYTLELIGSFLHRND